MALKPATFSHDTPSSSDEYIALEAVKGAERSREYSSTDKSIRPEERRRILGVERAVLRLSEAQQTTTPVWAIDVIVSVMHQSTGTAEASKKKDERKRNRTIRLEYLFQR
jgi:hypothetical protein